MKKLLMLAAIFLAYVEIWSSSVPPGAHVSPALNTQLSPTGAAHHSAFDSTAPNNAAPNSTAAESTASVPYKQSQARQYTAQCRS